MVKNLLEMMLLYEIIIPSGVKDFEKPVSYNMSHVSKISRNNMVLNIDFITLFSADRQKLFWLGHKMLEIIFPELLIFLNIQIFDFV